MSPIDMLRRLSILMLLSVLAGGVGAATLQSVAPVQLPHRGSGVDGPYFPRTRVTATMPTTGNDLAQQAQQRLDARLGANTVLSNGAAITKTQAQANGLGYIAKHFDQIDTTHSGRVTMSDVRQYLQQRQRQ
ncbi:2-oxoglutarate dehydrogenase [Trinickia symbiotica]|uniref:2-oxoglutarate dehydrogenase n=1 Tax=Trinickia symbiotica TaxID=863227 RepID=A0A2T3XN08_9BURK|nr:2-oxoglutarate dehydrogenase [Trinickia symbiotica]PTB17911.1 2-oxoglutarate dehydrogenase [Trinickia symbiotica]